MLVCVYTVSLSKSIYKPFKWLRDICTNSSYAFLAVMMKLHVSFNILSVRIDNRYYDFLKKNQIGLAPSWVII